MLDECNLVQGTQGQSSQFADPPMMSVQGYVEGTGRGNRGTTDGGNGLVIIRADEPTTTGSFDFVGEPQTVSFPEDATQATIRVWGAGGGGRQGHSYNNYNGGSGGYVEQVIDITPG